MLDYPNISIDKKTNEENMANVKSYLYGVADNVNYQFQAMQEQITALQNTIAELKGE